MQILGNHKKKRYLKTTAKPSQNLPSTKSKKNYILSEQRSSRIQHRELNKLKPDPVLDINYTIDISDGDFVNNNNFETEIYSENTNLFKKEENSQPLIKLPSLNKEALSQETLDSIQNFQEQHMQSQQTHIEFLYNYIAHLQQRIEFLEKSCETPSMPHSEAFKNASEQLNASDDVGDVIIFLNITI